MLKLGVVGANKVEWRETVSDDGEPLPPAARRRRCKTATVAHYGHCGAAWPQRRSTATAAQHGGGAAAAQHGYGGGPVGLDTLAAGLGEDPATLEAVVEPFLLQQGLLQCLGRGTQPRCG